MTGHGYPEGLRAGPICAGCLGHESCTGTGYGCVCRCLATVTDVDGDVWERVSPGSELYALAGARRDRRARTLAEVAELHGPVTFGGDTPVGDTPADVPTPADTSARPIVLVASAVAGQPPKLAELRAERPGGRTVQVVYLASRTGSWVLRTRLVDDPATVDAALLRAAIDRIAPVAALDGPVSTALRRAVALADVGPVGPDEARLVREGVAIAHEVLRPAASTVRAR